MKFADDTKVGAIFNAEEDENIIQKELDDFKD